VIDTIIYVNNKHNNYFATVVQFRNKREVIGLGTNNYMLSFKAARRELRRLDGKLL